jgi:hypothetical protein
MRFRSKLFHGLQAMTEGALIALVLVALVAGAALAGNGGKSSLSLVVLPSTGSSATTPAQWGDQVTFDVSTTATDMPSVQARCYQAGTLVYSHTGFFYGGASPSQVFTLRSTVWTAGAADCTARLYYVNARQGKSVTLATLAFNVDA